MARQLSWLERVIHNPEVGSSSLPLATQKNLSPCKSSIDALLTIAFARVAQQLGWVVIQFYEKYGTKGSLEELAKIFDKEHSSVISAAKVDTKLYEIGYTKLNLMSVGAN